VVRLGQEGLTAVRAVRTLIFYIIAYTEDNDVCFTTLEPIDARDFHISEVGEATFQELDLAVVRCKYSNELLLYC